MIRVEGFAGDVRGKKSLIITAPQLKQPEFQDFLGVGAERALFLHGKKATDPLSYHWFPWSAIVSVTRPTDWSFALTYLTAHQKSSLCFVDQSLTVPEQLLVKLPSTTTFCHFHDMNIHLPTSMPYYDYIFLPVAPPDSFVSVVQANPMFKTGGAATDLKEIFRELSVAGLGLVWVREDACFYWYEPGQKPSPELHSSQIGTLLVSIGQKMI